MITATIIRRDGEPPAGMLHVAPRNADDEAALDGLSLALHQWGARDASARLLEACMTPRPTASGMRIEAEEAHDASCALAAEGYSEPAAVLGALAAEVPGNGDDRSLEPAPLAPAGGGTR